MRSKSQYMSINLKLILICLGLVFLVLLVLRSTSFPSTAQQLPMPSAEATSTQQSKPSPGVITTCRPPDHDDHDHMSSTPTCTKISSSLAEAMVHYATSNITPQQTYKEISVSLRVLERKSPCNFLVFGLGRDSLMWTALNHGGRTVFLEEDKAWIHQIRQQFPTLESYHVLYNHTKVSDADELMEVGMREECMVVGDPRESKCGLALKGLPKVVYETEWDLIMVDAPTGYYDGAPGRMTAIYTAGLMARNRELEGETHVFVHDVDRSVEDHFSKAFLCQAYVIQQEGRIRHFTIPTHRTRQPRPAFCPYN
ncbi:Glucuronoxylan 4-O-methyltransferase [Actinidia chinensis var. chinensis]|uniref:Glucuronoxylan 4-O-methyltransferase n=1 Tax=Actinidia chinensis var. chinensis TaxID=1590841 RepID=A0A2R6Q176_ACTCC|nr:Glucuronoxylan 4-O-methyltransferase [Actinidia chinensis var. chinensis]